MCGIEAPEQRVLRIMRKATGTMRKSNALSLVHVRSYDPRRTDVDCTMTFSDAGFARLSTNDFSERDRVEALREIYGRTILKLDFEPARESPFNIDVTLRSLPNLGVAHGRFSTMQCRHTTAQADSDDLVLLVAAAGEGVLHQGRQDIPIRAGQAVLTSNGDTGTLQLHSPCEFVCFRFPHDHVTPLIADLKASLYRPIPENTEALRLLMHYAQVLREPDGLSTPALRHLVVTHINDLAALAVGATFDAAHVAGGRGMRAARLRAIKADIVDGIGQRDLTPDAVATRHGISTRYVRMMFEDEGTSLSQFVLGQRLARAYRMLTDPRFAGRSISGIAFEVGFGDLSYFNRGFRALYGMTPSDARALAARRHS